VGKRMGLARRAVIANRLNPPKSVRRGRAQREHQDLQGRRRFVERLSAFGDSASVRGNCLSMDVLQREEPRNARTTGERVLGSPIETSVLSVSLW
jgi:hypothetical protein